MRRALLVLIAAALTTLSACAEAPRPIPATAEAAAANGAAVLVSKGFAPGMLGGVQGNLYFRNAATGPSIDVMSNQGGFSTANVGYKVQSVAAGTYQLSGVKVGSSSAYPRGGDPLSSFVVRPGDVLYLGDIELSEVRSGRSATPLALIRDHSSAAQAALAAQSPQLAGRMQTRLLTCSFCRPAE